ncbi:MAG: DUF5343 domain-containing protein [Dehalococcoidia bacterium]
MATKYPYVASPGALVKTVAQLRKALPPTINAAYLKRFSLAPNNESYIINTLRFLDLIDDGGAPTTRARQVFHLANDQEFARAFEPAVREAYDALFKDHGDEAWGLGQDRLVTFFRTMDESSDVVGRRQATTFLTLSAIARGEDLANAGRQQRREPQSVQAPGTSRRNQESKGKARQKRGSAQQGDYKDVALAVRIEINLPVSNDQGVYDKIFRSIRANLIDAGHERI